MKGEVGEKQNETRSDGRSTESRGEDAVLRKKDTEITSEHRQNRRGRSERQDILRMLEDAVMRLKGWTSSYCWDWIGGLQLAASGLKVEHSARRGMDAKNFP